MEDAWKSSIGTTSQVTITNFTGQTITDQDGNTLIPNEDDVVVSQNIIKTLNSVDVPEMKFIEPPTIFIDKLTINFNTSFSEFDRFVNQNGTMITMSNPASVPKEDIPPNTTSISFVTINNLVSLPASLDSFTVDAKLTLSAKYLNGKTTISVNSSEPQFNVDLLNFSIADVRDSSRIITLKLTDGVHPIGVITSNVPEFWNLSWEPLSVTVESSRYGWVIGGSLCVLLFVGLLCILI